MPIAGLGERCGRLIGIGHVAMHGDAAELVGDRAGGLQVHIEAGDLRTGTGELACGRCPEA